MSSICAYVYIVIGLLTQNCYLCRPKNMGEEFPEPSCHIFEDFALSPQQGRDPSIYMPEKAFVPACDGAKLTPYRQKRPPQWPILVLHNIQPPSGLQDPSRVL
jgi:hypothetical protein